MGRLLIKQSTSLDIDRIREDFPILQKRINGKKIIYFDSAATGQKPQVVIDALDRFYESGYGKPNEKHKLSEGASEQVEQVRKKVARFIGAKEIDEIVYTSGCTAAINLVATSFSKTELIRGDEILITAMEHHANIIPWQMACERSGAKLKVVPLTATGEVDMDMYEKMITPRTRLVALPHTSHVMGTILEIKEMVRLAHNNGTPVLVDGAQAVPHMSVNMQDLGCDFYTIAGHKMGTPTGVGILYGKKKWLSKLTPTSGGGDMAKKVTFNSFVPEKPPKKFEAGTSSFADIIAMGALIEYVKEIDIRKSAKYEQQLLAYATEELGKIPGLLIYGSAPKREPVISFRIKGQDVKKLEKYLSEEHNIFTRAGDLTAQPLMKILGVKELLRVSFCYYNTFREIDTLVRVIRNYIGK